MFDKREYNRAYRLKNKECLEEKRRLNYTGIYGSWYAMKQRCSNPNNRAFKNYGGRCIIYCSKWETFAGFKEDMGKTYKNKLTLERINVDGNYEKSNCKWIQKAKQVHNTRKTVFINGKTLMKIAEETGLKYGTIRSRFYRGMNDYQIAETRLYRPAKL